MAGHLVDEQREHSGHYLAAPFAGINVDVTYDKGAPFLDDPVFVKLGAIAQARQSNRRLSLFLSLQIAMKQEQHIYSEPSWPALHERNCVENAEPVTLPGKYDRMACIQDCYNQMMLSKCLFEAGMFLFAQSDALQGDQK